MADSGSAEKKRSPIKMKPLRDPGQSLRDHLDNLLTEKVFPWIAVAVFLVLWATMEWVLYFMRAPRSPILFTLCATVGVGIAVLRIRRATWAAANLRLGIEGERSVGQFLESLRVDGYQVVHDIAEDGYNIDHALVGPTGVYAIETKTRSKTDDGDAQIVYDGEEVVVAGHIPDRDPLTQADAAADRVRQIIQGRTGQQVQVRPVVLYPGWFIQQRHRRSPRIWVVNENYLRAWLDHEPVSLSDADVQRYTSVLADHVRSRGGCSE